MMIGEFCKAEPRVFSGDLYNKRVFKKSIVLCDQEVVGAISLLHESSLQLDRRRLPTLCPDDFTLPVGSSQGSTTLVGYSVSH